MLKRIAKGLVQIVIAMVVLVVAINGYAAWTASPVKQYCSELKPGMSFEVNWIRKQATSNDEVIGHGYL